jgi:NAD(P)-dependent dehydrogenase (short-subunit alcohol dehydrogenase family)
MRLKDKVCVITGAGSGIGRAAVHLFSAEGADVVAVDCDGTTAAAAAADARSFGRRSLAIEADASDRAAVDLAVHRVERELGRIDVLCNNAGIALTKPILTTSTEEVDRLIDVNFKSVLFFSQAVAPVMIRGGGGSIVNMASNAGLVGRPWQGVYGASKAAVVSLTKSMALALAKDRVRVNCVCPGSIDTPMLRGALAASGNFERAWRLTELVIPLGRIGAATEIAWSMLFLASAESSYVTGIALPVDGGRTVGIAETSHIGSDSPDHDQ